MKKTNTCGYCWSTNVVTDSTGKYTYNGIDYDFEIFICDEKDNWCNHSWTLNTFWKMPNEWIYELLESLKLETNKD